MTRKMKWFISVVLAGLLLVLCYLGATKALLMYEQTRHPQKYTEFVEYYSGKYGMDPLLVYSFINTESAFNPRAKSQVGAIGLMQITEETFQWIKSNIAPTEDLEFESLYDPETAVRFGTYYLCRCWQRYGEDVATTAAAYHSGWGTVDSLLSQPKYSSDGKTLIEFPYSQMSLYVSKIEDNYRRYTELYKQEDVGI